MDPLDNEGTSKVLYCFACGYFSALDVARILHRQPPAVAEHIDRLLEFHHIRKGQKVGKFQHYEVDWSSLVKYAVESAPHLTDSIVIIRNSNGLHDFDLISMKRLKHRLSENRRFRMLFEHYLVAAARKELEFELSKTVKEYVANFEYCLASSSKGAIERDLQEWRRVVEEVDIFYKSPFEEALEELKKQH